MIKLMLSLIIIVVFGILVAFFATQNTNGVDLTLANTTLTEVPLYIITLLSLLLGILISWFISIIHGISSSLTIRGKEGKIVESKRTINDLSKKIHDLEIENAKLKGEKTQRNILSS